MLQYEFVSSRYVFLKKSIGHLRWPLGKITTDGHWVLTYHYLQIRRGIAWEIIAQAYSCVKKYL